MEDRRVKHCCVSQNNVLSFKMPGWKLWDLLNFLPFSFLLGEMWPIRLLILCVWFPKFSNSPGGIPALSIWSYPELWLTIVKGHKPRSIKRKSTSAKSRKIRTSSSGPLPGTHMDVLNTLSNEHDNAFEMLYLEKHITDSTPKPSIGGRSHRHPLPGMYQILDIPHKPYVCTSSLVRMSHSSAEFWK